MSVERVERDPETGSVYVYLEEICPGEAARQLVLRDGVILDISKDGKILGVEML